MSSVYSLLKANYQMRDSILKEIPEADKVFPTEPSDSDTKAATTISNVCNTFASIDDSIAKLEQSSQRIAEIWEELCLTIYWKHRDNA